MVVELRDKLGAAEVLEATAGAKALSESDVKLRDAILALISLGYKRMEAQDMVTRVMGESATGQESVEDLVRKALAR
jgi:Holliday junction resolvasome RuvABC DNA-binding subunit